MEPPVPSSGPVFRRAASFSHRQERALRDMNGRVNLLNKSQELPSTTKTSSDGQKTIRHTKRYSAVASRYAAPVVPKKQLSSIADGSSGGHANLTKLPFITGRSAPYHERRPSSDNLKSFQPSIVFTATARDPKANTFPQKVNSLGAKRPKIAKRASMIERKSQLQPRAPRFFSLDKGGCSSSKNISPRIPEVSHPGGVSLLNSAAHWLSLVKLAEGEKKHEIVIDLFRLAITLKAKPIEEILVNLKRYQESDPGDEAVMKLVQQCEDSQRGASFTRTEELEKEVSKSKTTDETPSVSSEDSGAISLSKIISVPPVDSESLPPIKKNVLDKPPTFNGKWLSRSSTFSCVDSRSQSTKAVYGKMLAKTLKDLPMQEEESPIRVRSPGLSGTQVAQQSPSGGEDAAQVCVADSETSAISPVNLDVQGEGDVQPLEEHTSPIPSLQTPMQSQDNQPTPILTVASSIVEMTPKLNSSCASGLPSANCSIPASDVESKSESALAKASAEKPVESLSEWLDGGTSEISTPDVQSALTEDTIDLSPNTRASTVKQMDVDTLMKVVVSDILPTADSSSPAEPAAAKLSDQPSTLEFNVRRKSWEDAGEHSMPEAEGQVTVSHRHSLSAEAVLLSVPGSVEKKVKLFTELACPGVIEPPAAASPPKGCQGNEDAVIDEPQGSAQEVNDNTQILESETLETPLKEYPRKLENETAKSRTATPPRVYSRQRSMKGETLSLPSGKVSSPSAAYPGDLASAGTRKTRHRRGSSVGNWTPRPPFDATPGVVDDTPSGSNGLGADSPSVDSSSSAKSKRMSRGHREVTPRLHLPKPSWKAIVEREMKGSKLKDLLAAELPKETSPLAEYVETQMENQKRDPESGSSATKEKDLSRTSSQAKPVRKITRSASKKQAKCQTPVPNGDRNIDDAEPRTGQKTKKSTEVQQEMDANTAACLTPGSAMRRSARLQSKVQSRRNMLFKEEFAYMK